MRLHRYSSCHTSLWLIMILEMYRLHRDKVYYPCTTKPKKNVTHKTKSPRAVHSSLLKCLYLTEALNRPYCHIDARFCCSCSACCDATLVWSIYDASLNYYGFASHGLLMQCSADWNPPLLMRISRLPPQISCAHSRMHSFPAPARCRAHQENQKNS